MNRDAELARCCIAMWIFDHPNTGVVMEEIEDALRFVPDKVVLLAREDDHDMILFLRTFADNHILQQRIHNGDIKRPAIISGTLQ